MIPIMTVEQIHALLEDGQRELSRTDYLEAARLLSLGEAAAWELRDCDLLAQVYLPLQEARRQIRQRCGEGLVRLDLIAGEADAERIVTAHPSGQILVAGMGTIAPSLLVRRMARERRLYLDTFLAAAYETAEGVVRVVIPEETCAVPESRQWASVEDLTASLPFGAIVLRREDVPTGARNGSPETYATVMALWERLHAPFLAMAESYVEGWERLAGYRRTMAVDPACELAHQNMSAVARRMSVAAKSPGGA